jgi:H+/gluconate symporter-like permease
MGLLGILLGLGLLVWLAFRGWSVLGLAPVAALIAAAFAGDPLLANWTQTFMGSAAGFIAQFFPLFLLGALFGKLMDDSGSVTAIAQFMTERLGPHRAILAVVLAGALVTYGGVSVFVAMFVLAPMGQALFRAADVPNRLLPGAVMLGTATFTMSALPGTPAIQNAIPMPFFGTTPFAAPGLGFIAAAIMLGFGLWWLARGESAARRAGEGFAGPIDSASRAAHDPVVRERATASHEFDPAEVEHGTRSPQLPGIGIALLPLIVVILVNLTMSLLVLPRLDTSYLAELRWGETSLASVGGVWSVIVALALAIVVLYLLQPGPSVGAARHGRRGPQCVGAARAECCQSGGLWCGRRVTARLRGCARLGTGHRRWPAGGSGARDQCALGTYRFGLGRSDHCPWRTRRNLYAARRRPMALTRH